MIGAPLYRWRHLALQVEESSDGLFLHAWFNVPDGGYSRRRLLDGPLLLVQALSMTRSILKRSVAMTAWGSPPGRMIISPQRLGERPLKPKSRPHRRSRGSTRRRPPCARSALRLDRRRRDATATTELGALESPLQFTNPFLQIRHRPDRCRASDDHRPSAAQLRRDWAQRGHNPDQTSQQQQDE